MPNCIQVVPYLPYDCTIAILKESLTIYMTYLTY